MKILHCTAQQNEAVDDSGNFYVYASLKIQLVPEFLLNLKIKIVFFPDFQVKTVDFTEKLSHSKKSIQKNGGNSI